MVFDGTERASERQCRGHGPSGGQWEWMALAAATGEDHDVRLGEDEEEDWHMEPTYKRGKRDISSFC